MGGNEESCSPHSRDIKRSVGCPVWIWESLVEGHRTTRCRKDQEFSGVKYEIVLEVKKAKLLGKCRFAAHCCMPFEVCGFESKK